MRKIVIFFVIYITKTSIQFFECLPAGKQYTVLFFILARSNPNAKAFKQKQ